MDYLSITFGPFFNWITFQTANLVFNIISNGYENILVYANKLLKYHYLSN